MRSEPVFMVAAAVTVILGVIELFTRGRGLIGWLWRRLAARGAPIPRDTVRVVPQGQGHWWAIGSRKGQPVMQVVGRWHVTNVTRAHQVYILRARVVRPPTDGRVLVQHPESDMFGEFPVLPGTTRQVHADFWIEPPVCEEGKDFKAKVVLVDQFGNEHSLGKVVFKGPEPKEPQRAQAPEPEEKGLLDYIVEGNEASAEITRLFNSIAQATRDISERMEGHNRRLADLTQPRGGGDVATVRRICRATAADMTRYAVTVEAYLPPLEESIGRMGQSIYGHLEWVHPKTAEDKDGLRQFREVIVKLREGANFALRSVRGFRESTAQLSGISGELTRATHRQTGALDAVISILETAKAMSDRTVRLIDEKLSTEHAQEGRAESERDTPCSLM